MFRLVGDKVFDGFGPGGLSGAGDPPMIELALPGRKAATRKLLRAQCPRQPGVYGMIDADGKLIYVGKSKCLRARLLSYLSRKADPKAQRIIASALRLVLEPAPQEFTALLREIELIRRWCPKFNVKGHPGRLRRAYIALGRGPAPYAYVAEQPSGRDRLVVGPLRPTRSLRRMVEIVNDQFRLRDCPKGIQVAFRDPSRRAGSAGRECQPSRSGRQSRPYDAPVCIRRELGTCLGPCCGGCSSRQYADRVRAAGAFLRGSDLAALDRLERSMRSAAACEQFERAASFRDALATLRDLHALLEQLRTVRETYSFVYPLPSYAGGQTWYFIHRGQVISAAPAPINRRTARECLKTLEKVYPSGSPKLSQIAPDDPDLVLIVSGWFREYAKELARTIAPEEARRRCLEKAIGAAKSA